MAHYEIRINEVTGSVFAIGEKSSAYGSVTAGSEYQDVAQRLAELTAVLDGYGDTAEGVAEMRELVDDAQREVHSASPDKQRIRRLLASMRAVLVKAGSGIVGAGAVAEAIAKIADAIQHL